MEQTQTQTVKLSLNIDEVVLANMPGHALECVAKDNTGVHYAVVRPKENRNYAAFRLFIGYRDGMEETPKIKVEDLPDGGIKIIDMGYPWSILFPNSPSKDPYISKDWFSTVEILSRVKTKTE